MDEAGRLRRVFEGIQTYFVTSVAGGDAGAGAVDVSVSVDAENERWYGVGYKPGSGLLRTRTMQWERGWPTASPGENRGRQVALRSRRQETASPVEWCVGSIPMMDKKESRVGRY